jgi:hypothetical protein
LNATVFKKEETMTQTIPALKIAAALITEETAINKPNCRYQLENEMNTITIVKSETGWNACYGGGPHAAAVQMLFATDTLPTAFTPGRRA